MLRGDHLTCPTEHRGSTTLSDSSTSETDHPDADPPEDARTDHEDRAEPAEGDAVPAVAQSEVPDGAAGELTEVPESDLASTELPSADHGDADQPDQAVGLSDADADADAGADADASGDAEGSLGRTDDLAGSDDGAPRASDGVAQEDLDRLENEGDIAADYLEELLDIADLDGDLDMDVEGDRASVSIVGGDVRLLVGRDGEVLEALQELTRLAVYRETGERSRLMLDVGGFRADKRSRLEKVAAQAVDDVKASGQRKALDPMTPFERKVVHDVVAAAGLSSASEGQEPRRYVVVLPE
jgi:spoIIIJ-associated protein